MFLAVASTAVVQKVMEKVKAVTAKKEQPQKCDYCGNQKYLDFFWEELPEKSGKYRANKYACYYKDMKWEGKRLEVFKRTGHDCPHVGEVCTKCGNHLGGPKAHKHPQDCPFK